jgi:hypothetical protein
MNAPTEGPRVHQSDVDAAVKKLDYSLLADGRTTVCLITLHNGYTVWGASSCVSELNYVRDIGERIARENAYEKVWAICGYALREQMHGAHPLDAIARVCHEVNREYCRALGDDSQPSWEDAPEWQRASARMGVDLHLMGDFGPEASHISWLKQKEAEGWKYGPVKDADKKEHPCYVPYDELPPEQQAKDYIFRAIVHALRPRAEPVRAGRVVDAEEYAATLGRIAPKPAPVRITPTVGRVVWYFRQGAVEPWDAHVCHVNGDGTINVGGFDNRAVPYASLFVPLIQEGEPKPTSGPWCEWMPYQQGQARK